MESLISREEFNKYFAFFTRFLKDNGYYTIIYKYIFYGNRTINDFYESVSDLYFNGYDFGDILHITYTIGNAYRVLGHDYWDIYIKPIDIKWRQCFRQFEKYNAKDFDIHFNLSLTC